MASIDTKTVTQGERSTTTEENLAPVAGLVLLFCGGQPAYRAMSLEGGPVKLGRAPGTHAMELDDERVSRRHATVELTPEGARITDLKSRNGTYVDGRRIEGAKLAGSLPLVRAGKSLLRVVPDVTPFLSGGVERSGDEVVGPTLRAVRDRIARTAAAGDPALFTGPSGAGKELAARLFHRSTGRSGPFIAVNCAAIPAHLAERLLFGARRGAYSGAVDHADGYVQAAEGGTLFLDEIGEIDPVVQPKLLRLLEAREAMPLGAAKPQRVNVQVCAATLKDLRAEVSTGRFREDLYFRLGRPEMRIPGLSERIEEIPWILCAELRRVDPGLTPTVDLVEACALRPWPGNVRDLVLCARQAARAARDDGRTLVDVTDLPEDAGLPLRLHGEPPRASEPGRGREVAPRSGRRSAPAPAELDAALARTGGNVTAAARLLGCHRTQLRRWLAQRGKAPH